GIHGWELWKTDGTADGTALVTDIRPGELSSNPTNLIEFNGLLYFTADDGIYGRELWVAGGTLSGAEILQDLNIAGSSDPSELTVSGEFLFFRATTASDGAELWRAAGLGFLTIRISDFMTGPASSQPLWLVDVGGTLFFSADSPATGRE